LLGAAIGAAHIARSAVPKLDGSTALLTDSQGTTHLMQPCERLRQFNWTNSCRNATHIEDGKAADLFAGCRHGRPQFWLDWAGFNLFFEVLHPEIFLRCQCVGAAIAQVSGEVERVVTVNAQNRDPYWMMPARRPKNNGDKRRCNLPKAIKRFIEVEQVPISYCTAIGPAAR